MRSIRLDLIYTVAQETVDTIGLGGSLLNESYVNAGFPSSLHDRFLVVARVVRDTKLVHIINRVYH